MPVPDEALPEFSLKEVPALALLHDQTYAGLADVGRDVQRNAMRSKDVLVEAIGGVLFP